MVDAPIDDEFLAIRLAPATDIGDFPQVVTPRGGFKELSETSFETFLSFSRRWLKVLRMKFRHAGMTLVRSLLESGL